MGSRSVLRWQQIWRHRRAIGFVAIALAVFILLIVAGYWFDWTGFGGYNKVSTATEITSSPQKITKTEEYQPGKTLWDWLQLLGVLAIPVVVGLGTVRFTQVQLQRDQQAAEKRAQTERDAAEKRAQTERDIAFDNQREVTLQDYIDSMSELLLDKELQNPQFSSQLNAAVIRELARARTLTALQRLDSRRKGIVLQFLYDMRLIFVPDPVIVLSSSPDWIALRAADFSNAQLRGANLSNADLRGINLREADLREANLEQADLSEVDLRKATMDLIDPLISHPSYTDPRRTRLGKASLVGADLSEAQLYRADFIEANMYNTTLHKADLSYAHLTSANLERAELVESNLNGAFLDNAILKGANLSKANLQGASLRGATLTGSYGWEYETAEYLPERERLSQGADLSGADLSEADLSEADLTGAYLKDAIVTLEQLKKAKSLEGATMPDGSVIPGKSDH